MPWISQRLTIPCRRPAAPWPPSPEMPGRSSTYVLYGATVTTVLVAYGIGSCLCLLGWPHGLRQTPENLPLWALTVMVGCWALAFPLGLAVDHMRHDSLVITVEGCPAGPVWSVCCSA